MLEFGKTSRRDRLTEPATAEPTERRLGSSFPETPKMEFIDLPNFERDALQKDVNPATNPEAPQWYPATISSAPPPARPGTAGGAQAGLVAMATAAACTNAAPTPAPAPPTVNPISTAFDRAEAAAQSGDWPRAAQLFEEIVRQKSDFGPGWVGFASAALALGRIEDGIGALEHACSTYPQHTGLKQQLGVALAHAGRLQDAQDTFLAVLDIDPNNVDALVSLAHCCRAAKQYPEAVEILAYANSIAPQSPEVLGAIGQLAYLLGDRRGAEDALRALESVAPDHAETQLLRRELVG